jgi:flagellar L-ring protein FlgH
MKSIGMSVWVLAFWLAGYSPIWAAGEPVAASWASLATDRVARKVGDTLTVIINENSTATGTAQNSASRDTSLQAQLAAGAGSTPTSNVNAGANLALSSSGNDSGSTSRAGSMAAEISVAVDAVLPNGDLHVAGKQSIDINGELTTISVSGRVRLADISSGNAVLSSDLAEASIKYSGDGFVTESSSPGIVTRALNWLGL